MHFDSLVWTHNPTSSREGGRGEEGRATRAFAPRAPSVRGPPNGAELFQIRSGSFVSSQSSFFKGVHFAVLLISSQPAFLLPTYADDANFKLLHTLSYVTTAPAD